MRKRSKIILSILVFWFVLFIAVNLPVEVTSTWQECDYSPTTYNCFTRTGYESYLRQQYGCNDWFSPCDGGSVKTVALSSATLYAGQSATNSTPATSKLTFALDNPGSTTHISSLILSISNTSKITTWDNASQVSSQTNLISFNSTVYSAGITMKYGAVTSFTYYPASTSPKQIIREQTYDYVINFQNGQSVSGSLITE
jgi:hypothetical protein